MNPIFKRSTLVLLALCALGCSGCRLLNAGVNTALRVGMAKLPFRCVPAGTMIDTPSGQIAIEDIEAGALVTGFDGEAVKVLQKHSYAENPTLEHFHKVRFTDGAVVDVCDMHRIADVRARRLIAGKEVAGRSVESVEIYGGVTQSYDLLTEDSGYQVNGVPVNSMIEEMADYARTGKMPQD